MNELLSFGIVREHDSIFGENGIERKKKLHDDNMLPRVTITNKLFKFTQPTISVWNDSYTMRNRHYFDYKFRWLDEAPKKKKRDVS